jgi:hypothetical protein
VNTIRRYLDRQWTPAAIPQMEWQSNAALRATIPVWVTTTAVEVAVDTLDCPFYGQSSNRTGAIMATPNNDRESYLQRNPHDRTAYFDVALELCLTIEG